MYVTIEDSSVGLLLFALFHFTELSTECMETDSGYFSSVFMAMYYENIYTAV